MSPIGITLSAIWVAWLGYWIVSARHVKSTAWEDSTGSQLTYRLPPAAMWLLIVMAGLEDIPPTPGMNAGPMVGEPCDGEPLGTGE